jgi:serine/threonine protein kinase
MGKFSMEKSPKEDGFVEFNQYFKFVKNLGAGGFGKVVLAEDLLTQRQYAVKVLPTNNILMFKSA